MELDASIQQFASISLEEMEQVALLNRVDTKFVLSVDALPQLFLALRGAYRLLETGGKRRIAYATRYFDTPGDDFYHLHQRGKANRQKVRIRSYLDSDLHFLEFKRKSNKGRTDKQRLQVPATTGPGDEVFRQFVTQWLPPTLKLLPTISNRFFRLTFVHLNMRERFTVDLDLRTTLGAETVHMPRLVIAELKQSAGTRSTAYAALKALGIRPQGFSKYCMGYSSLRPDLKANNFKPAHIALRKIQAQPQHHGIS